MFAQQDKDGLNLLAASEVSYVFRHLVTPERHKLNTIIILKNTIPQDLVESVKLPCQCGERHSIIRQHSNQGNRIHLANAPKLTPRCKPVHTMDEVADYLLSVNPGITIRGVQSRSKPKEIKYVALKPMTYGEWKLTHKLKNKTLVSTVKARPERAVIHKERGLSKSELAIDEQRLQHDFPSPRYVRQKTGTPDWLIHDTLNNTRIWVEGKTVTDRFDAKTQDPVCSILEATGDIVLVYPAERVS